MKFSTEEKTQLLDEWGKSGKSAWAYAKEKGFCPQTFNRWVRPKKGSSRRFVELPAKKVSSIMESKVIIIEKGETKIHVPLHLGHEELHTLFRAIGTVV